MPNIASSNQATRVGVLSRRTVHLHLSGRSTRTASPRSQRGLRKLHFLPLESLLAALPLLRSEGYEIVSFSGDGLLLYPWLSEAIATAKAEGFLTAATMRGLPFPDQQLAAIADLDQVTISFDGTEMRHNVMRGNSQARARAVAALRYLAGIGQTAVADITVTRNTLAEVPEFIDLCAALGVRTVQLRPLDAFGKVDASAELGLTKADYARLWLMARRSSPVRKGLIAVEIDQAPIEKAGPDGGDRDSLSPGWHDQRLSDAINPLVITCEGRLRPWRHDFDEEFELGQLQDLVPVRRIWIGLGLPRLRRLVTKACSAAEPGAGSLDGSAGESWGAVKLSA